MDEEVFGVREITIRAWLCRSGMQGKKLHERFLVDLELIHMQLHGLWANIRCGSQDLWLWVASDTKTNLVPVFQVGGRNQEMAFSVVHELKGRFSSSCVPVFSTNRLKHYGGWADEQALDRTGTPSLSFAVFEIGDRGNCNRIGFVCPTLGRAWVERRGG